jgi:hypothetical protein
MRFLACATLIFAALNPGCACNGNGHVAEAPFVARVADNVVNCNCNLTFKHENCSGGICKSHFDIKLCLPPHLNVDTAPNPDAGAVLNAMSDDEFAVGVNDYCKKSVTNIAYHMIKVFNGGWCDYKAPFAPDGGVGESVVCFAHASDGKMAATAREEATCAEPCEQKVCDFKTNCGNGVQDEWGNIHLDRCNCTQILNYGCPGDPASDLPTPTFCRPPLNATFQ